MDQRLKSIVDAAWAASFDIDPSTFARGGVHIVEDQPGSTDVASVLIGRSCVVRVPPNITEAAHEVFSPLSPAEAFTVDALDQLIGDAGHVLGLSWHHYGDETTLRSRRVASVEHVSGGDPELLSFLQSNSTEDWSESGFPEEPAASDPKTTTFHALRKQNRIVAAGNMTAWRDLPADVGVLVHPSERGQNFAVQLVGAMVEAALPRCGLVRYRALSTNIASLTVADRLGFERYGGNYLARLAPQ